MDRYGCYYERLPQKTEHVSPKCNTFAEVSILSKSLSCKGPVRQRLIRAKLGNNGK
jgi:hypothetical protein